MEEWFEKSGSLSSLLAERRQDLLSKAQQKAQEEISAEDFLNAKKALLEENRQRFLAELRACLIPSDEEVLDPKFNHLSFQDSAWKRLQDFSRSQIVPPSEKSLPLERLWNGQFKPLQHVEMFQLMNSGGDVVAGYQKIAKAANGYFDQATSALEASKESVLAFVRLALSIPSTFRMRPGHPASSIEKWGGEKERFSNQVLAFMEQAPIHRQTSIGKALLETIQIGLQSKDSDWKWRLGDQYHAILETVRPPTARKAPAP